MQEISISSWNQFGKEIECIKKKYSEYTWNLGDCEKYTPKNNIIYRGQANSSWKLETTLERSSKFIFSITRYMEIAVRKIEQIQAYTDKDWQVKIYPDIKNEIIMNAKSRFVKLPHYNYLAYLRHHGFPSPLLDWTDSPYVAAYFALCENIECDSAVFCYIDSLKGVKSGWVSDNAINWMGPYAKTHKRHFAQKSSYTISTRLDGDDYRFAPHEIVFDAKRKEQDILVKIIIPNYVKKEARKNLRDYNINAFTLFNSEDALIKSISQELFDDLQEELS